MGHLRTRCLNIIWQRYSLSDWPFLSLYGQYSISLCCISSYHVYILVFVLYILYCYIWMYGHVWKNVSDSATKNSIVLSVSPNSNKIFDLTWLDNAKYGMPVLLAFRKCMLCATFLENSLFCEAICETHSQCIIYP